MKRWFGPFFPDTGMIIQKQQKIQDDTERTGLCVIFFWKADETSEA